MTTQVTKISSKIVKSITAAVLLAACTSSMFASDFQSEINDLGKTASADIRSEFIADVNADRINLLSYADSKTHEVNNSNFAKLGKVSIDSISNEFVASAHSKVGNSLTAALSATPYQVEDRMVVYANSNVEASNQVSQTTLLPSVAAYTEFDFSETFDRIVLDTFSVAFSSNLLTTRDTFRNIE